MGDYEQAADFYDLLYASEKDYAREAELLADLIRTRKPDASTILDVGCGTGAHALGLIEQGFEVTGVDIEPAFVEIAEAKCPDGDFVTGDMRELELPGRFDAVVCLFSVVGYALTPDGLTATIEGMSRHLADDGVVLVDPWFEPHEMTDGYIVTTEGAGEGVRVVRMSRTVIEGAVSTLEFEYLIGTADGIERRREVHSLGLFTEEQMRKAFIESGLRVERIEKALRTRGIYVGTR